MRNCIWFAIVAALLLGAQSVAQFEDPGVGDPVGGPGADPGDPGVGDPGDPGAGDPGEIGALYGWYCDITTVFTCGAWPTDDNVCAPGGGTCVSSITEHNCNSGFFQPNDCITRSYSCTGFCANNSTESCMDLMSEYCQ